MAVTDSNKVELGSKAPDFSLLDVTTGQTKTLSDFKSKKGTVIMFICNHCPYVKHVQIELVLLAKDYQTKGVSFVAINSNDAQNYPDDSPEKMKEEAKKKAYPFSYLFDETQEVAKKYDAACTPDFYIYDQDLRLVYHGQLDDSRPGSGKPVTGKDMRQALDNLLSNQPVQANQKPSQGCNIKWK
ncbi:MAG: alkyl hydroperoxide reductase [Deltaproteobacteria bacterium RIFCSPHIGHO2_02_FULL_40_11]|nr:MAG: alkyl hydroperoxide reductase [Deltaproteobacteria bacterium RIFCSPHIGHO2_02_FULL_40_11]